MNEKGPNEHQHLKNMQRKRSKTEKKHQRSKATEGEKKEEPNVILSSKIATSIKKCLKNKNK